MSARTRTLFRIAGWAAIPVVLLLNLQLRGGEQCRDCLSHRGWSEWRFGVWQVASMPLLPRLHSDVVPSQYARDFGLAEHEHAWAGSGHTAYVLFGTTTIGFSCGGASRGWVSQGYENAPALRDLIADKLRKGELTRADVHVLVVAETRAHDARARALEDALLDEYTERESSAGRL